MRFSRIIKHIAQAAVVFAVVFCTWYHDDFVYGLNQAYGQISLIFGAKPISDVLAKLPDSVQRKLALIAEVKRFAEDVPGLKKTSNYTTWYDQKHKPLMYVVTGCEPYNLRAVEFNFPIAGSFGYKGFFDYGKALKEKHRLQYQRYDARISTAGAWSTLGFLPDPVLSSMTERSPGDLAETIIHELFHATVYLKNASDLNENLAQFVGTKGAVLFLSLKFGVASPELNEYIAELHDDSLFNVFMLSSARKADSMYNDRYFKALPSHKKRIEKQRMFAVIRFSGSRAAFSDTAHYHRYFRRVRFDNTRFPDVRRYESKHSEFDSILKTVCHNNLTMFVNYFKTGKYKVITSK